MSELVRCEYCDKLCKGTRGLNTHLRSCDNNTGKQVCSYCTKIFTDLSNHTLKCKDNPANHSTICKFCGATRKDMQGHMAKCSLNPENGMICLFCNKKDPFSREMKGHMENCLLNPINAPTICEFCNSHFKQKTLINHQKRCIYNPALINCEICNGRFEVGEYEFHITNCANVRGVRANKEKRELDHEIKLLTRILFELSVKLKYNDTDEMLQDHDLSCSVCYEPTCDKTTACSHPICIGCLNKIINTNNPKCPICRCQL